MKLIPWDKRILVELDKVQEQVTDGGIVLPDKHHEESRAATVLAIGSRVNEEWTRYKKWYQFWKPKSWVNGRSIQPGQRILITFYAGIVVHMVKQGIIDDTRRIITESNILSLVEE